MQYITVFVTCANTRESEKIASSLLEKKLIACASQLSGIKSRYWWHNKLERSREVLLIMKTRKNRFRAVSRIVKELHSYEVPEIVALPIVDGERTYLSWIEDSVS